MNDKNDDSRVLMVEDPEAQLDSDFPVLASRVDAMVARGVSLEAAYMVAALLEVSDALVLSAAADDGEDDGDGGAR